MATMTHTESPPDVSAGQRRTNWLLVVIVGLVAAALGVGAGYLLFAPSAATEAEPNAEVQAMLDDWWAASEAGDVDAMLGMMPEGFTIGAVDVMAFGYNLSDTPQATVERLFANNYEGSGADTPSGDPMVVGEYGVFDAAQRATQSNGREVLYLFKFIWEDGLLRLIYVDML